MSTVFDWKINLLSYKSVTYSQPPTVSDINYFLSTSFYQSDCDLFGVCNPPGDVKCIMNKVWL